MFISNPESKAALAKFVYAAKRYHEAPRKKVLIKIGSEKVEQERIFPRSIEQDYFDAKIAVNELTDPGLKTIQEQIDVGKILDRLEGSSESVHKQAHQEMVQFEKELAILIK